VLGTVENQAVALAVVSLEQHDALILDAVDVLHYH